jgi:DNA repair exonuclease SbcCD nuclease subunit
MTIKILHAADIHVKLRKNKVDFDWQLNRFKMFFTKMLELEKAHDITILAGDIFDEAPELDEVTLFSEYLHQVTKPTIVIPGNHEATLKGETFLEGFVRDRAISNPNVQFYTKNARFQFQGYWIQLFPYTEVQTDNLINYPEKEILVTHIRGKVPPHITAEYDFDKIKEFKLVLCGDLHFYHQYEGYNVYYPGSPLNITFDRNDKKKYGVLSHTFWKEGHIHNFIDLQLPKLLRKKIKAGEDLVPDPINWVVYEVEGKLEDIQKVKKKKSVLLDKTIIEIPTHTSVLDLKGLTLLEEVDKYLKYQGITDTQPYLTELTNLGIK